MTRIGIPDFSLVVLVGATGAGKSTLARRHFRETEIVSSDACRAVVADDETDQNATADAFDLVHHIAGLRLKTRRLTVIDSTAARKEDRAGLIRLGRHWHAPVVALVLDIDPALCHDRNKDRANRRFGDAVPRGQSQSIRRDLRSLKKEGFSAVHILRTPDDADGLAIVREPLWTDRRTDTGPFDVIGDVHGCFDELTALLETLGYDVDPYRPGEAPLSARHPQGRKAIFVGDLCDRGPRHVDVLRLAMGMAAEGTGDAVIGNHDFKLLRWLGGRKRTVSPGLALTVADLERTSQGFRDRVRAFIDGRLSHLWLDGGRLVVAHAGLKEEMHGRGSPALRQFAMFGDTTGESDEDGLPVRLDWVRDYRGTAAVIYGHTPALAADWVNGTICIDTGCAFGGKLTALRWPEKDLVSVPALQEYAKPARPLAVSSERRAPDLLFFDELLGKRRIETRWKSTTVIPEANAAAALEVLSRFGIDPRWLIYLPPTMAPCPTAPAGPWLEHPDPALDYYQKQGIEQIVAQEKHMGSRGLVVVCRDAGAAAQRFGVEDGKAGVVYTRTGRPFFKDEVLEAALIARVAQAVEAAGLWATLETDWLLLDAELMPWSAKAQDLLRRQYAPAAVAAQASAAALAEAVAQAGSSIDGLADLGARAADRLDNAHRFETAIRAYCWETAGLEAFKLAPFHLLAAEGRVFDDRPHSWHMGTLATLCGGDPILLLATAWRALSSADAGDRQALVAWWTGHTEGGGEGMVLKPAAFVARGRRGLAQPAMKVRGPDYLRIIYGPDYTVPATLERLRPRGLERKWSLAIREFSLGFEGLHRFVERAPLAAVHECALGVLALESEPIDPRL